MSIPMHDVPEHFIMPVDADGNGPVTNWRDFVQNVCWCGVQGCQEWRTGWGLTHPLCEDCWMRFEPGRVPHRMVQRNNEKCAGCGSVTFSGIYYRADPASMFNPARKW